MEILNRVNPSAVPWEIPLETGHKLDLAIFATASESGHPVSFFFFLTSEKYISTSHGLWDSPEEHCGTQSQMTEEWGRKFCESSGLVWTGEEGIACHHKLWGIWFNNHGSIMLRGCTVKDYLWEDVDLFLTYRILWTVVLKNGWSDIMWS